MILTMQLEPPKHLLALHNHNPTMIQIAFSLVLVVQLIIEKSTNSFFPCFHLTHLQLKIRYGQLEKTWIF